jgi:hypothetical protein
MNDILEPVCERFQVNLITGVGEMSITQVKWLFNRMRDYQRPCRVHYISDFDPAGQSIPVAVARKVEWFIYDGVEKGFDVKLFPLVLTKEQCEHYRLPRSPIKEKERRKEGFEERHGEGATELDALEALHPGELEKILSEALGWYFDDTVDHRVRLAKRPIRESLNEIRDEVLSPYLEQVEQLRQEHEALAAEYEERAGSLRERTVDLWQAVGDALEEKAPVIDEETIPEAVEVEEFGEGLFNSERSYLEQFEVYKRFQGKKRREKKIRKAITPAVKRWKP